jgi:hypothetical protein
MITLFACPKSFQGHIDVIQRNAIKSWTLLTPRPEIILLGDDEGVAEICSEFDLIHVADIEKNKYGTPLVRSVFQTGQERASHPIVCYVNSDIILMSDFLPAVETSAARFPEFLMVGQRWDLDIENEWDFASRDWETHLRTLLAQIGVLHAQTAMDFFAFPRGMYSEIPSFAIGRTRWDNWLMWRARSKGIPVVDATAAATIVHQNHEYVSGKVTVLGDEGPSDMWHSPENAADSVMHLDRKLVRLGPEAQWNNALAPGERGVLDIWVATWMMDGQGALRRRPLTLTPAYLKYQLKWVVPLQCPTVGKLYRSLASAWHSVRDARKHLVPTR